MVGQGQGRSALRSSCLAIFKDGRTEKAYYAKCRIIEAKLRNMTNPSLVQYAICSQVIFQITYDYSNLETTPPLQFLEN